MNEWEVKLTRAQLIDIAPRARSACVKACSLVSTSSELHATVDAISLSEPSAMYVDLIVNDQPSEVLGDSGAAQTCISKNYLMKLGLTIDEPSDAVFTLGNGQQISALGVAYDLPIQVDGLTILIETIIISTSIYKLILGSNWF